MTINTMPDLTSRFLSVEKDASIIVNQMLQNNRLKKLLYYNDPDCLNKPNLTEEQSLSLINQQIRLTPKIYVDSSLFSYLIINFDNFINNARNPHFRNNTISIDVICHFDSWMLKDFQMRPYKIAAELDYMFNKKRLTGIGVTTFIGAGMININDEFAGISVNFLVIHGDEDQKQFLNPIDEENYIKDQLLNYG